MASPLNWFRKRQKSLLVVFGVVIIVAFTVGPILLDALTRSAGPARENVARVSWQAGTLHDSDLDLIRRQRFGVQGFLGLLASQAETPRDPSLILITAPGAGPGDDVSMVRLLALERYADEIGVVVGDDAVWDFLELMSGGTMSRDQIRNLYLQQQHQVVNWGQLFQAFRREIKAGRTAWALARMPGIQFGLQGIQQTHSNYPLTPLDAWDYYRRVNQRMSVEMLELKVADFVDQVGEPSEKEIRQLYDNYKTDYPEENRPTPGFMQRDRVAFEYIKADPQKWIEKYAAPLIEEEAAKVTDEEIRAYYEENKNQFIKQLTDSGIDDGDAGDGGKGEGDTGDGDAGEAEKPTPKKEDQPEEKPSDKPDGKNSGEGTGDQDKAGDTSTPEKSTPEKSTPEKSTPEEKPADGDEPPADEPKKKPAEDDLGDGRIEDQETPSRFVAFFADDAAAPDAEAVTEPSTDQEDGASKNGAEKNGAEKNGAEKNDDSTSPPEEKPASGVKPTAESEKKTADPADTGKGKPEKKDSETSAEEPHPDKSAPEEKAPPTAEGGDTDQPKSADDDKPGDAPKSDAADEPVIKKQYRPLSEVKEEIRTTIATQRANRRALEKMEDALRQVRQVMSRYEEEYEKWAIEYGAEEEGDRPQPPSPPSLEDLAAKYGFTRGRTSLMDRFETADHEIGKARFLKSDRETFVDVGFKADEKLLYDVRQIPRAATKEDLEKLPELATVPRFVYWRVEVEKENIPQFASVKDKVVRAWKLQQAVPLAEKKAQQLADQLPQGKSLTEAYGTDHQVVQTEEFAWLEHAGLHPQGGVMALVDQVQTTGGQMLEGLGRQFMSDVSRLQPGQVGVAKNNPHTKVYVVRMVRQRPSSEELTQDFLTNWTQYARNADSRMALFFKPRYAAVAARQRMVNRWYEAIEDRMEIQWLAKPRTFDFR